MGTLGSYVYTLDNAGNRQGVTEADGSSITWGMDDAYHLLSETRKNSAGQQTSQVNFTYDPMGNRQTKQVVGQTTSTTNFSYNALDQLTDAGSTHYTYDGRGNLTQMTASGQNINYSFNAADQMTGVNFPTGPGLSYQYDASGHRVQQVNAGVTTNYLWDEESAFGDVVAETNQSGAVQANYIYGRNELLTQVRGATTSYYLHDGQGSVRALTNISGTVTDRYSYEAFGVLASKQGSTTNAYLYTGQQFDATTGLYSLRARMYNPGSARFFSRDTAQVDPQHPDVLDGYLYTSSNPTYVA